MNCKTFYGKRSTSSKSLNQLIDQLHEERFDSANVYINPPREDSDGDSELSENDNDEDVSEKFSSKILAAPAEATLVIHGSTEHRESSSDDDEPLINYVGKSKKIKLSSKQEKWYNQDLPVLPETVTQKMMQPPTLAITYTKEQTILYATQQNANTSFSVTVEELKVFFAILLISGYSKRPRKDMYWSMDSDLRNEAVARGIELGLGASVVSTFANRLKENFPDQKFNFFLDNFFTGLPLIKKLSALDYGCTGTIRQNRIEKCPLNKSTMKKSLRGSMDSYVNSTKDVIVMQWKDNSIVHVASNCFGLHPTKTARRYSAAEKKYILVEMPHAIQQYNNHMGGTDLMDRNISNYRPQLRNNKWWWQIVSKDLKKKQSSADEYTEHPRALDLLGFIRYIVSGYLLLNPQEQRKEGALFVNIPDAVSKNMSVLHHPNSMKQNRCRVCKKNTTFGCGICTVNLHPLDCFSVSVIYN
nr:unnamed protein product [Callosobruchus analis]